MKAKKYSQITKGNRTAEETRNDLAEKASRETTAQNFTALLRLWRQTVRENYEVPMVYFTRKEEAQFKHMLSALPVEHVPHRGEFLRWVIVNWSAVVRQAREDAGVLSHPAKPLIGFLLKYVSPAVQAFIERAESKPVNLSASGPFAGLKTVTKSATEGVKRDKKEPTW